MPFCAQPPRPACPVPAPALWHLGCRSASPSPAPGHCPHSCENMPSAITLADGPRTPVSTLLSLLTLFGFYLTSRGCPCHHWPMSNPTREDIFMLMWPPGVKMSPLRCGPCPAGLLSNLAGEAILSRCGPCSIFSHRTRLRGALPQASCFFLCGI